MRSTGKRFQRAADSRRAAIRVRQRPHAEPGERHATFRNTPVAARAADAPARLVSAGRRRRRRGVHWNGVTWRWTRRDFTVRTHLRTALRQEVYSRGHDGPGLGRHLRELEPYYDKFELTAGVSAKPEISAASQAGGNSVRGAAERDIRCRRSRPIMRPSSSTRPPERAIIRSRVRVRTLRARIRIPTARISARASIAATASASAARRTRRAARTSP